MGLNIGGGTGLYTHAGVDYACTLTLF